MTAPIVFVPHGGGPMPLLNEPNHRGLISFLNQLPSRYAQPEAIVMISAHWEEKVATVNAGDQPELIFDYQGFQKEAYEVTYPAPGNGGLAEKVVSSLHKAGLAAATDRSRGYDHGVFVPLKLMYPQANIPVVQLSLVNSLDPQTQIAMGKAIGHLAKQNILIVGSGMSFHNMRAFMSKDPLVIKKSEEFDQWLNEAITSNRLSWAEKEQALINWKQAPHGEFCHPREEHLLPLHVCFGAAQIAGLKADNVFDEMLLGVKTSAFLWE